MIQEPTLFIVGAGASLPLGFPLGTQLVNQIAQKLQFTRDWQGKPEGDQRLWQAIKSATLHLDVDENQLFEQSLEISQGLALAESIDNYVFTHSKNQLVPIIAKLTIGMFILDAEYQCVLRRGDGFKAATVPNDYWVSNFCRLHFSKFDTANLDQIFEKSAVICFNYDRNIQQSIRIGLASYFRLSDDEATKLSGSLPIIHPYGWLGNITRSDGLLYGTGVTAESIQQAAKGIRTFTEGPESPQFKNDVLNRLDWAKCIVFLGFGYGQPNLSALTPSRPTSTLKRLYGTAVAVSGPNIERLNQLLPQIFNSPNPRALTNCSAGQLLDLYSMELF